jgi:hypothetical protein
LESFVGRRWLLLDEDSNAHAYEFLRDGRVIMSVVGKNSIQKTIEGTWELLPSERLYIKRPEPIVLEQAFLGEGLLVFQESGTLKNPFILFDPKIVVDGDVEKYLNRFLEVKEAVQIESRPRDKKLPEWDENGEKIWWDTDGTKINGEITDPTSARRKLIVRNGRQIGVITTLELLTDKEKISIISDSEYNNIQKGSKVLFFETEEPAEDGWYKLNDPDFGYVSIEVENGVIKQVNDRFSKYFVLFLLVCVSLFLLICLISNKWHELQT